MHEPSRSRYRRLGLVVLLALAPLDAPAQLNPSDERFLASERRLYSQKREEVVIRHFFQDRKYGFFVDVGAYDWKKLSTTYFLERHLGWSGIAIDALPEFAEGYESNRPRTKFFNYIVTDRSGAEQAFYRVEHWESVSSTSKPWIQSIFKHFFGGADPRMTEIMVPTTTLTDLLERNHVERINFLSMDIEGSEPEALAGFDIDRFQPKLVCIEASPTIRSAIAAYFESHGYERIEEYLKVDAVNWYYTPRRTPPAR